MNYIGIIWLSCLTIKVGLVHTEYAEIFNHHFKQIIAYNTLHLSDISITSIYVTKLNKALMLFGSKYIKESLQKYRLVFTNNNYRKSG